MNGIELIAKERQEQVEKHGNTVIVDVLHNSNADDGYAFNMMPLVAGAIGLLDEGFKRIPKHWNTNTVDHMRSKPYKERLVVAAALLAAEIDRLEFIENEEKLKK